jgi:hypothetical protein
MAKIRESRWRHPSALPASLVVERKTVSRFKWSEKKETLAEDYDEGLLLI